MRQNTTVEPMRRSALAQRLVHEFSALTGMMWEPDERRLTRALEALGSDLSPNALKSEDERRSALVSAINSKLRLHQPAYRAIIDGAAQARTFFNYHEKVAIQQQLDTADISGFEEWVRSKGLDVPIKRLLLAKFVPLAPEETFAALRETVKIDPDAAAIKRSIFRAFVFGCFPVEMMHRYFANEPKGKYERHFYDYLTKHYPAGFQRDCGLIHMVVDDEYVALAGGEARVRDHLFTAVRTCHQKLSNHCYFALIIKPLKSKADSLQWKLYGDVVLFAEKYREEELTKGYFHPGKVAAETMAHVPDLNPAKCAFELANDGFYYKDCFCIRYADQTEADPAFDLLLLFEKNERDETPIPCPACRSLDIGTNSYPVLGVRSWECQNPICPECSKYDRGNRYSFVSLLRQEAIEEDEALIAVTSLRRWKRDIVTLENRSDVLDMLVRHYTLIGDPVELVNVQGPEKSLHKRPIRQEFHLPPAEKGLADAFFLSPFFHRIGVGHQRASKKQSFPNLSRFPGVAVYNGDALEVLRTLEAESIDGAVTSPPYYNAREYATWPNIYCFLHDMTAIAEEVYRVLKPGSFFLYNIFDYFDNERNIVFSLMGKKRMILGPYCLNLFQRVGFNVMGNTIWDKGEIEGKRNFNQGNASPYYQAPFNCWEHILVFAKGKPKAVLPNLLASKPVMKMVRGENVLGHTAPYPESIPNLLLERLKPGSTVLDPFSGSMTTGRAAFKAGFKSVNIDMHREYCDLGLRLLKVREDPDEGRLFG
ncbi:MAG: DNA-methyltransferase [Phycisphaerales bacterium]